jgi:hypothetical protein
MGSQVSKDSMVTFCPRCYCTDVEMHHARMSKAAYSGYECSCCGFSAPTFPEGDPVDIPPMKEGADFSRESPYLKREPKRNYFFALVIIFLCIIGLVFINRSDVQIILGTILLFTVLVLSRSSERN